MKADPRKAVSLLVLTTIAFCTAPGRILPDTKLDMALAPGRFLVRALHMWDPSASFGQVQNQAYGYFFPMGPFYWLFDTLRVTPWITQRLWLALVLCTAFLGVVRLAEALRIGAPWARLAAGFAYALAPRAQELLGVNSSEFWPTAVLPWILLPLVTVRSRERAAALSALAVVCCGGINATAELAVLTVPLLYLLFHRRRLLAWWLPLTAAASFWWLAPTWLMGRTIFPFIAYTETATTTTSVTSPLNVLRGTSQWNGFLPGGFSPWWPAGFTLSTTPWLIFATTLLAGLGLAGLRRSPHRAWLLGTVLAGLAVIVAGHDGSLFAGTVRSLLDGPLSPFRNLHKFDALLRLPLVLGLAHLSPRLITVRGRRFDGRLLVIGAVAATTVPVLTPGLGIPDAPREIPQYVRSVTAWLDGRPDGTVLAVPGQQFGQYLYGKMMDDPLQPLLDGRWASRMITPGGSVGAARLMEAIDQRFATGQGTAGLKTVLERMGVRYLMVRNDVDRAALNGAWPVRVHAALDGMGLRRTAAFGSRAGFPATDPAGSVDQPYDPVEIFELDAAPAVTVAPARPVRVDGGPEALLALADAGMLTGPVIFNSGEPDIATDTFRRREVAFSDLRGGGSPTLTADQPYSGDARVKDLLEPGWRPSVAELSGISAVTASSSASELDAVPSPGARAHHPFAALDGDPATSWTSSGWKGADGQWLELRFPTPITPSGAKIAFEVSDLLGPAVDEVTVVTDTGRAPQKIQPNSRLQTLAVPPGATSRLRVEITGTVRPTVPGNRVAVATLTVPGVDPARTITLPATAARQVFTGLSGYAPACVRGPQTWVCAPSLATGSEEGNTFDRSFTAPAGSVALSGSAILTDPALIARLTDATGLSASSTAVPHPAASARAAFDGDPATTWQPAPSDRRPALTRTLDRPRTISSLRIRLGRTAHDPISIRISSPAGSRDAILDDRRPAVFAPLTTDRLTITFPRGTTVTEVEIPGIAAEQDGGALPTACGSGPEFTVDGRSVPTRLTGGNVADVLAGRPLPFRACAPAILTGAGHRLTLKPGSFLIPLVALGAPPAPAPVPFPAPVPRWTATDRTVTVSAAAASYLVVNENQNSGWKATLDGVALHPLTVDGWKQAWLLPAGSRGTVHLVYTPDRPYRLVLLIGLALALTLLPLAACPSRHSPDLRNRPSGSGSALTWAVLLVALWAAGPAGALAALAACGAARRAPSWAATALLAAAGSAGALAYWLASQGVADPFTTLTGPVAGALTVAAVALACVPRIQKPPAVTTVTRQAVESAA
ncbi:alpha-(1-_3)-arabinofuranosyltransferase [Actinocorallia lasiicapitis]